MSRPLQHSQLQASLTGSRSKGHHAATSSSRMCAWPIGTQKWHHWKDCHYSSKSLNKIHGSLGFRSNFTKFTYVLDRNLVHTSAIAAILAVRPEVDLWLGVDRIPCCLKNDHNFPVLPRAEFGFCPQAWQGRSLSLDVVCSSSDHQTASEHHFPLKTLVNLQTHVWFAVWYN